MHISTCVDLLTRHMCSFAVRMASGASGQASRLKIITFAESAFIAAHCFPLIINKAQSLLINLFRV